MRLFALLTASTLALFVSPSVANSPVATVIITTDQGAFARLARSSECVPVDSDIQYEPVTRIDIAPYRPGIAIDCTFFRDPVCHSGSSHSYTLHEGSHTFKRPFLVSSFGCVASNREDAFL
ncbi:hypothetical protein ABOM_005494 [Aspergillus bombycis]|uniref:Uncharacterized protein n=1 Tax=Aspergillus bombycis TaxID=109264 RepID=A0A1F8A223_9EURO|nr:hypothetical protein ABOM_005494 [Aspergillus bombycis]OGM45776.1 hypothetical protein ABOM_005494 [Aspergillus bombycis]